MLEKCNVASPWMRNGMNTRACNIALTRLAGSKVAEKGFHACRLLQYMFEQSDMNRKDLMPDIMTLNTVLAVLSKSGKHLAVQSAKLADEIFEAWNQVHGEGKVNDSVDIVSYNTLLSSHVRARNLVRAEEVFSGMKKHQGEIDGCAVRPDVITFATLMRGYALEGKVARVEALLEEMNASKNLEPTVSCFNELLYAYSKSNSPRKAEEYLNLWLEDKSGGRTLPNVQSYNIVLYSFVQSTDSGLITRAERLFNQMPKRDSVSFTTLVSLYCLHLSGRLALESTENAVKRALVDPNVHVDATFISNMLYSIATVEDREMPNYAERLVASCTKKGVKPSIDVYNALIYCWSKSGDYEAARRVRQLLGSLETQPELKPNLKTYTNVLDCFAKSRELISLDYAKAIVEKLERYGPKPNVHTYTSLIQNYARSPLPYKAVEAFKILRRMKASDNPEAQPNIVSYNAVLNAAEHSDPSGGFVTEEALKVACITFDEIRTSKMEANHVTYGTFLGVLAKLMPSLSRQEIVGLVFRRACKEGQVSALVLRKLLQAAGSREKFLTLLEGHDEDSIPKRWKANVQEIRARDSS